MAFDIEVISKEIITPSSPTPNHLNKLNLSYIDQFSPSRLLPLVLFYPSASSDTAASSSNSADKVKQLKNSLSDALTKFYPLAGRIDINNNTYINCNDKGVLFLEAQANCMLFDVINNPIPSQFSNFFLPLNQKSDNDNDSKDLCMIVQTTCFSCGGMAIGIAISHKLVDGSSVFMFVKTWAAISRGEDHDLVLPEFNSATLFPPRELSGFNTENSLVQTQDIVTKRFVFTASNIAALRRKYTNDALVIPSRVEALSAFIWTRFMISTQTAINAAAAATATATAKIYMLVNVVNLRTRADPPFPDSYFGNMYWPAIAMPPVGEDKETGFIIVEKVRESIHGIDADYVKELRERNEQLNIIMNKQKDAFKGELVPFSFSSLCRFPLYEADFGWGKPVWVGTGTIGLNNLVTFLDSLSGDGIEAWIDMSLEDMAKFEADHELLSYVSTSGHDASFPTV